MKGLPLAAALCTIVFGYLTIGSVCVLVVAWVNARYTNKYWFNSDASMRWGDNQSQNGMLPPIAVLLVWPVMIVFGIVAGVGFAFMRATERIGDRLIAAAEKQRKALK